MILPLPSDGRGLGRGCLWILCSLSHHPLSKSIKGRGYEDMLIIDTSLFADTVSLSKDGLQKQFKSAPNGFSDEGRSGRARAAPAGEMAGGPLIREDSGRSRPGGEI